MVRCVCSLARNVGPTVIDVIKLKRKLGRIHGKTSHVLLGRSSNADVSARISKSSKNAQAGPTD